MSICFITDPLVTTMGAVRPALLLAKEFSQSGREVRIVTPRLDKGIEKTLQARSISAKAVGPKFSFIRSFPTLDAWARCLVKHKIVDDLDSEVVINTSSCIIAQAHVYYAQGLMTRALDEMFSEMPPHYRYNYYLLRPEARVLEKRLISKLRKLSKLFIANSGFCASMYKEWNIRVDGVISPPLDCAFFKSSTSKLTADYVLTNFGTYGKEGKSSIIKRIADAGVAMKVFGDARSAPKALVKHKNVRFLGKVSNEELVQLYSDALYVLFAFAHEPFGYIPIESMACGTPVLTYRKQGPSETVIDGKTGWLAGTDTELVKMAVDTWKSNYDSRMRRNCRERALAFDIKRIYRQWTEILSLK